MWCAAEQSDKGTGTKNKGVTVGLSQVLTSEVENLRFVFKARFSSLVLFVHRVEKQQQNVRGGLGI